MDQHSTPCHHRRRAILGGRNARRWSRIAGVVCCASFIGVSELHAAGPITKGPWVQRVTSSSAVVRVEVDPPAAVTLDLTPSAGAVDTDAGHRVVGGHEVRALHAITLQGLSPSTRYAYSIRTGAASTSRSGAFTTAPPEGSDAPFRFLVYGDNRTDDVAHGAIVRAMTEVPSDFLVHTGDFVADGASGAQWQAFFDTEAPLLGARCVFSCVGNHELTDGAGIEYVRFFGPTDPPNVPVLNGPKPSAPPTAPLATRPEHLNGTFRWGNSRFFLLNGMVSMNGTVDRSWLEKALGDARSEADLKWRIVVVHHGPWSSGPHGNNARLHDAGIPALLVAHGVDLVISGHDHIYERGWSDGLAYVVSGGGGAPTYKIKAKLPQAKTLESSRHFVEMAVSPASMQLVATRMDGSTLERCAITKNAKGWDCDQAAAASPGAAGAPSGGSASSSNVPTSTAGSRCGCRAVGAGGGAGGALAVLAVLGLILRRARRSGR